MSEHDQPRARRTSRGVRRFTRFLARSWQGLLVAALAIALGVLAHLSPGLVQADVHLDEGTVYAGNRQANLIGTVNAQIDELAGATAVGPTDFTVLQEAEFVAVHGHDSSTLARYNPAMNRLEPPTPLPRNAQVMMSDGVVMVAVRDSGKVYRGRAEDVLKYEFNQREADFEVGRQGTATVTASGDVIGLNLDKSVLVRPTADGIQEVPLPFQLDPEYPEVAMSAVGDKAVVLDRQSGRIWVEGMPEAFEVDGAASAQLAAPAPDSRPGDDGARAIYATAAGLIKVTSDGPRSLSGKLDGAPVAPVQVGDCAYGVIGARFVKKCRGQEPIVRDIPDLPEEAELTFQVNRGTVALNDLVSGRIWMVDKDMLMIADWQRVAPKDSDELPNPDDTDALTPPDRTKPNKPPVAKDDTVGARANRSTILPILDNDSDPDGDILTISSDSRLTGASLQTVRGGSGVQITVDGETAGTLTFQYTISDGRGGSDTATVTVRVLPADPRAGGANQAPTKSPIAQTLKIQKGESVTKRVLLDWRDPDGDALILVKAWLPQNSEDEVSYTPDGQVTFVDIGKTTGTKKVLVQVSDGYAESQGEMVLNVGDDVVAPVAYGDFETASVNKPVTIHPLANDVGANMILAEVQDCPGNCTISPNYRERSFTFTATKPGPYYVPYKVTNGPVSTGLVRIDVRADAKAHPPVAALDVALLPPGGSVLVDPVANDTDADGDVLVIQSVTSEPGIEVVLERRHLVTVTASHTPDKPVTLKYRLSDGHTSVLGTIVIIPTPATGTATPRAERDEVLVRAGSTQAMDVVANDVSPIGLDLRLDDLVENPLGDNAWIDGDRIRVSAPAGAQGSSSTITYQVKDSEGAVASSQLRVTVVSEDAANEAPAPEAVVERVLAGTTQRLTIPLEGIDGNGDSVRLVGLGSGPRLGRIMSVGDGWMTYEAFDSSQGTDIFAYQVVDAYGAVGTGEIRVGVAPAGPDNSPPVAVLDDVQVRPGRHVQLPALRNDVDIDGDAIAYQASDPVEISGVDKVEVGEHREISFVAPAKEGAYTGTYYIEDARGMSGSGQIALQVAKDAPLLPPETRDDLVSVSSILGQDFVKVSPLDNDLDPDGPREQLRVSLPGSQGGGQSAPRVSDDGRSLTIPVRDRMQQVRYLVTDADGLTASGLILVPGRNDSVPALKDPALVLSATAGQPLKIDINTVVSGTDKRAVELVSTETVSVTNGNHSHGTEVIEYTPDISYEGPAAVVFEVRDVVAETDRSARRAFISIPVKVAPSPVAPNPTDRPVEVANSAPTLVASKIVLQVGPDEGESRLALTPLFKDPDGDNFYFDGFAAGDGSAAISWRTNSDKTQIFASAPIDARPGTYRIVNAKVRDASDAENQVAIRLEVVSSRRALASAGTDVVDEAVVGGEVSVPVLANDRSNLDRDKKLRVVAGSATVISGGGAARTDGDTVRITPSQVGLMTVRYTVMDATNDPARQVDGTVRVTVKDRPGRPGAPRDGRVGNGQVTFNYTPGPSNGYEITSRTAYAMDASGRTVATTGCKSTTCTVTGLPNGKPYTFKVVEANRAGQSEPSPTSTAWIPDVKPNAPAPPAVQFGNGQLSVAWRAPAWENPANPGSPVTAYTLLLLDQNGSKLGEKVLGASPTSHVWKGLTNGRRYKFRVIASNAAGSSPVSGDSNIEWPAGPPGPVSQLTAVATQNELGGAFTVSFPANAAPNGDPVTLYTVTPVSQSRGRVPSKAVTVKPSGGAELQRTVEGLGQDAYRFEVVATNKAGSGTPQLSPQWKVAWSLPRVTAFKTVGTEGGIDMAMSTNYDSRPGTPVVKEYRIDNAAWQPCPAAGKVRGLVNGREYSLEARINVNGEIASSPAKATATPRTAVPVWPRIDENSIAFLGFKSGEAVVEWQLAMPASLEDSGGWALGGYGGACSMPAREGRCYPSKPTKPARFSIASSALKYREGDRNEDRKVTVQTTLSHEQHQARQSQSTTILAPFRADFDQGPQRVLVNFKYVSGGRCDISVAGLPLQHVEQPAGSRSWDIDLSFPPPAGQPGAPSAALKCTWDRGTVDIPQLK